MLYHRVAAVDADPLELAVSPAHFDEHLTVLRRWGTPVSLASMVASVRGGKRLPRRAVALTVDDGYADLVSEVAPALERHGVPATAYVTTGAVEGERFWWDRVAAAVTEPAALPDLLSLDVAGSHHRWEVHGGRSDSPWEGSRPWLLAELQRVLRAVSAPACLDAVASVEAWSGVSAPGHVVRPTVTADGLRELASGGLVEVGAHTHTHPRLSDLSAEAQSSEIVGNKAHLEEVLERPVTSFAYPYGGSGDYDSTSVACARSAGFTSACTNVPGRVTRRSDPFELPRVHVSDCDGDGLERVLCEVSAAR